jgi:hypothetical protein
VPFIQLLSLFIIGGSFLLEAVNSALNQTLPKDEHETIVVNNFLAYDDIKKLGVENCIF